ncbi:MAG: hypothetical protein EZS28_022702 [Streblomastix strix]|uniref:Uncharacterized protein n=1 Tax=Streblomastix strix TaxID=222440 RepID=A0A5J4VGU7_9EUKA|nr:MAG: hypothetical protein EZS28_022702 [Streblomastix strix]
MEEVANIDVSVSIIDDEEQLAAVCIPPKQLWKRNRYDVRRTNDLRQRLTKSFFVQLIKHREHFQHSPTDYIHLFWTENWKRADQRHISSRFENLVQTIQIKGTTANCIRPASSTELAAQDFDGRTIYVFTHHSPDSKMNNKFYVFAVNKEHNSRTSALVKNYGMKQATYIISKQRGDARIFQGDDLWLSPQKTLVSHLSLPIISTQPIVEAESPNDHESVKGHESQMQKDDQDVKPREQAQNSSMTKDSDRETTAGAKK